MSLPLFLFTIVFVAAPLIYMVALSLATNNEGYGVTWSFTLENYTRAGVSSDLCTVLSAGAYQYDRDYIARLSIWLFYGEAFRKMEAKGDASFDAAFLGKFADSSLWMDYYFADKGNVKRGVDEAGNY